MQYADLQDKAHHVFNELKEVESRFEDIAGNIESLPAPSIDFDVGLLTLKPAKGQDQLTTIEFAEILVRAGRATETYDTMVARLATAKKQLDDALNQLMPLRGLLVEIRDAAETALTTRP